jgi:crotonobetainyl-CoA:carnitine CoA-transferase CaiB-like acyl-CoA transferase
MDKLPLESVRVIDLSHSWAGPHCTRILADFGAEVIKVEYVPRLCLLRGAKKTLKECNHHPAWFQVNRNKYSITLNLKIEEDRNILKSLIKQSNVVVHNSRTGVMEKLGFGYEDLVKLREDLIVLSMSAFGNTGPYSSYAGYGAVFEALGGIQCLSSYSKNAKPTRVREMDIINGVMGASAVMTALVHHQKTGEGQHIDLSQMEAATHATIGDHLLKYSLLGVQTPPMGNRHDCFAPQGCYRCRGKDKWVVITIRSEEQWRRFCLTLDRSEWIQDDRFATNAARKKNHDTLDELIGSWTRTRDSLEVMDMLQQEGIPAGAVLDVEEIAKNRHLQERGYFLQEECDPNRKFMGTPYRQSQSNNRVRWRGPDLGQHNRHVLCNLLRRSGEEIKPIREEDVGTAYDPE